MRYEVICEKGDYALIIRKNDLSEYAVVNGLDKENGEWAYTVGYWMFGNRTSFTKEIALMRAVDRFLSLTDENYIPYNRMSEIASKAIDGLFETDVEYVFDYFLQDCDIDENEMEYFGINEKNE